MEVYIENFPPITKHLICAQVIVITSEMLTLEHSIESVGFADDNLPRATRYRCFIHCNINQNILVTLGQRYESLTN
jgi:hypothetical protein